MFRYDRHPRVYRTPLYGASSSLSRKGTPVKGPSGRPSSTRALAMSNMGVTTALIFGLCASMTPMAASTTSAADTSPLPISSASPTASYRSYSENPLMPASELGARHRYGTFANYCDVPRSFAGLQL